ncbi:hypothetical protein [Nitrosomonas sp.]|uniref:hypothetical protein n=1 Tax=Nitrosomonas sp. TaxID=42353 RepID=UPI001DC3FB5B|nr:hypothetical protein [Nitrosomonas sp.]MCB1947897.1 hypothetical protein [Nitrosomonas sp.]
MAKQNRKTLEAKFKNGSMPSEIAFADLIDSTLNLIDDGFDKTVKDGLRIFQLGDGKLMSFYQKMETLSPLWFVGLDKATSNLRIGNQFNPNVLTLRSIGEMDKSRGTTRVGVGINTERPQCELDVAGTVAAHGRTGKKDEFAVPADGEWYDISGVLTGCQAFEVVAGVGGRDADGKYALMHAFALCTYYAKNHISYHQAHYGAKCNQLELRWEPVSTESDNFEFVLQLRTGIYYGNDIWVKYHITRLWEDTAMYESEIKPEKLPVSTSRKKR